jgi:hypothetical protein
VVYRWIRPGGLANAHAMLVRSPGRRRAPPALSSIETEYPTQASALVHGVTNPPAVFPAHNLVHHGRLRAKVAELSADSCAFTSERVLADRQSCNLKVLPLYERIIVQLLVLLLRVSKPSIGKAGFQKPPHLADLEESPRPSFAYSP